MIKPLFDIVVLFGPPAGGKTGPGDALLEYGYERIVCSDTVKKHNSDPAIAQTANGGSLWSDEVVNAVMGLYLNQESRHKRFILDGFPRSEGQFAFLMERVKMNAWSIGVLFIDTPIEECRRRRQTRVREFEEQGLEIRRDDTEEVHERRLSEYLKYAPVVLGLSRRANLPLIHIPGMQSKDEVKSQSLASILQQPVY